MSKKTMDAWAYLLMLLILLVFAIVSIYRWANAPKQTTQPVPQSQQTH